MSRAVVVSMKRRAPGETVKPWRERIDPPMAEALGKRLAEWADSVREKAMDYWPDMPDGVADRDADCWEALLSVADLAGGHWPTTARSAAVAAVVDNREDRDSEGVTLLKDVREVFRSKLHRKFLADNKNALKTPMLLSILAKMEESPWGTYRRDGSPIDSRSLGQLLKSYGIKSHNIRWADGSNSKGYFRKDFADAWQRYLTADADAQQAADDAAADAPGATS